MSDNSITEKDRIYTESRKTWCRKTTKEGADKVFQLIEKTKEDMKTRGTTYVTPAPDDWVIELGDYRYTFDPEIGEYTISYTMKKFNEIKEEFYADSSDYEMP